MGTEPIAILKLLILTFSLVKAVVFINYSTSGCYKLKHAANKPSKN